MCKKIKNLLILFLFVIFSNISSTIAMVEEDKSYKSTVTRKQEKDLKSYVKVYVWSPAHNHTILGVLPTKFKNEVGHASLEVVEKGESKCYISFWPGDEIKLMVLPTGKHYRNSYERDCYGGENYEKDSNDLEKFKRENPHKWKEADTCVKLYTLNTKKIVTWFNGEHINRIKTYPGLRKFDDIITTFSSNMQNIFHWKNNRNWALLGDNVRTSNCSSLVLEALKKGGIEDLFSEEKKRSGTCKNSFIVFPIIGACFGYYIGSLMFDDVIYASVSASVGTVLGFVGGFLLYFDQYKEKYDLFSENITTPTQIKNLVKLAKKKERKKYRIK